MAMNPYSALQSESTRWYMGKSRRARVPTSVKRWLEVCARLPLTPAKPGAARRCACFGQPQANRSQRHSPKMKQCAGTAERESSELRVACRNCVLSSHADFSVRQVFAGRPGELVAIVVLLFTLATPCLHRHRGRPAPTTHRSPAI